MKKNWKGQTAYKAFALLIACITGITTLLAAIMMIFSIGLRAEYGNQNDTIAELMQEHAERLLNYYALRKKVSMRYLVDLEQAGKWVNIHSMFGNIATSLIESQSIDLTGGFIGTATCRGYSALITDLYYAGQELYAGEDVII